MAQRRRRRRKGNQGLKLLIGILTAVLGILLILALALPREPDDPVQTDPPAPNHTTGTTAETTQATAEATQPQRQGWAEESGKKSYYENGVAVTGAHAIDGKIYCFDAQGVLLGAGWQETDGRRYYLKDDGSAHTGWMELPEGRFYFRADGTVARGEEEIDGIRRFFTSAGRPIDLVNPWNYVPEGYAPELKELPSSVAVSGQKVDSNCYDALMRMMNDCMKAGHQVCVVSSYRTQAYQQSLFDRQVAKQMAALNCTREEAEQIAATISAIPGTSEHQLGLAVDIVDTRSWELSEIQETLPGQIWLMENSWRYGFILRYPNGTTAETGIIYEPWHYRYVGTEVAAELHESGQTLEGYLAALD